MSKKKELLELCKSFIEKHSITCPECIYQSDRVIVDAYVLIEQICEVIGYVTIDDAE